MTRSDAHPFRGERRLRDHLAKVGSPMAQSVEDQPWQVEDPVAAFTAAVEYLAATVGPEETAGLLNQLLVDMGWASAE